MKIVRANYRVVEMPLEEPYAIAYQYSDKAKNLFLELLTDAGIVGLGCAAPDPAVTGEEFDEAKQYLESMVIPGVVGEDPLRWKNQKLFSDLAGFPSVRCAIEMACLDIVDKKAGVPVWKLLGGIRSDMKTSITIGILPLEETIARANHWVGKGFQVLKIKGGNQWELDAERMLKVREVVGDNIGLRFDANQGYSVEETLKFSQRANRANIEVLEQPTAQKNLEALSRVSRESSIPVMADESLLSDREALVLARNGVKQFNIKLMKVGGVARAQTIAAIAEAARIDVMIGCGDEAALGVSVGLHFALSTPSVRYIDLDGHIGLIDDPTASCLRVEAGSLIPSEAPGFGVAAVS